jgi:ABC-2 type transport system ATP-binding protein
VKPIEETSRAPLEIVAAMRDVTMTYDGYQTRALVHADLEFRRGEVVGILGAKGAGKSTVLKILAGRLRPSEGVAKIFGRSAHRSSARARVGYLPGKIDAGRSRGFFGRLVGSRKESSTPARGLARLTQAILGSRELLVFDDPFEGLEPAEFLEAKALVRDLVARGKTVILSSESLMDIKELCQRFVILHEGKVQATGTLPELLATGGAIRFFPAVLPRDLVERVLDVLRKEILGEPVPKQSTVSPAKTHAAASLAPGKEAAVARPADHLLTPLTRPAETPAPAPAPSQPADPIDHGKLEELTKSKKPD